MLLLLPPMILSINILNIFVWTSGTFEAYKMQCNICMKKYIQEIKNVNRDGIFCAFYALNL